MKVLKRLMKGMGVSRGKPGRLPQSSSSSGSKGVSSMSSSKRRAMLGESGTCTTDSTSHRSLNSSSSDCAAWRVERIRVEGPPGESDWWTCQSDDDDDDNEGMEITTEDETLNTSGSWLMGGVGSSERSTTIAIEDSKSFSTEGSSKKFHNCGLETWERSRAAWTAEGREQGDSPARLSSSQSPSKRKELGKILSRASSLRTYELPRRTPLKDLVESYQVVWNGDD